MASQDVFGKREDTQHDGRRGKESLQAENASSNHASVPSNMDTMAPGKHALNDRVKLNVIVAGAGIAGLGAAITLSRAGHEVTVCFIGFADVFAPK